MLAAIALVAKHVSATWEWGGDSHDARLSIDGRQVALAVANLSGHADTEPSAPRARLREDKVALRVVDDLERALNTVVPADRTIVVTLGAPIKEPAKLVETLTDTLATYLGGRVTGIDERQMLLGNRVRFRVSARTWNARVAAFVFSGDPRPEALENEICVLGNVIASNAATRPANAAGEHWLVLVNESGLADLKTYRRFLAIAAPRHDFERILMVQGGKRILDLTNPAG